MSSVSIYLRVLLVSLLVAVLGLAPYPHAVSAQFIRAKQAIASGDFLSASKDLADAAQYFPWRYDLNIKAANLALEGGNPQDAIQYFERPGTVSHLTYDDKIALGDAYYQVGDSFMAEAIWKYLTDQSAPSSANERLANLYLQRKDYASAVIQLQNLLNLNPSDIQRYYQIGTLYAATDPVKALPFLAQAEQLDTIHAAPARELHDKIRTASLSDDPAYLLLIAGRQLANSGDWELAAVAFQNVIDLKPDYADGWAFLGEARGQIAIHESGAISAAGLYELDHALSIDADSVLANTFIALYYERNNDYDQAKLYLERAIALSPEDPFLYSELGNLLAKSGDLPAAQSAYINAIQVNPQDPLFYRLLAGFALEYHIQIREIALPAARQAITLAPQDAASLDMMAQVMLELQDYRSAERFLLGALQADPNYSWAYLHLGTAYLYLGKSDLARHYLSLAQTTSPEAWIVDQAKRMLEYYFP